MKLTAMLEDLQRPSKSDAKLAMLLDEVHEFTQVYVLAKQRHKGCSGTGELMTLREEYTDVLVKLIVYCAEKGYPCDITADDPDAMAASLTSETGKT